LVYLLYQPNKNNVMTQVILIRFGETPNPAITAILAPHMIGKAIATPVPGAIMSVFNTESEVAQIAQELTELGPNFFIFKREDAKFNLPEEFIAKIDEVMGGEAPKPARREWTVDEVLDIIADQGINALTPEQRAVLGIGQ
jgi:hypothetical protein